MKQETIGTVDLDFIKRSIGVFSDIMKQTRTKIQAPIDGIFLNFLNPNLLICMYSDWPLHPY